MKILHILDHSLPLHSGYTFRSRNLFAAQKSMGYQPVVLTSPRHEASLKQSTAPMETIDGIRCYRTGTAGEGGIPLAGEVQLMRRLYRRMLEVAENEQVGMIHAHSPILNAIPAIFAARRLNIPVVYEIRAFWEDAAVDHGTYRENSWKYRLTKALETWVCRRVDHVFILCNGLKKDLESRGIPPEKITPVFNGIHPAELKPVSPDNEFIKTWRLEGKKVLGFVGSFYRYEGLDLLVKSFARIVRNHPDCRLLLVGGGETAAGLADLVSRLGIEDRVVMPGRIPHERIAGVYAMIDILVYPRYSMRLTELVTPLKPLEAMAMGKALVASDVGGHRELIHDGKTGLLFRAGNPASLTAILEKLLNDAAGADKLGRQGCAWVRNHHTWEKTTAVYRKIYRTLQGCGKKNLNANSHLQ